MICQQKGIAEAIRRHGLLSNMEIILFFPSGYGLILLGDGQIIAGKIYFNINVHACNIYVRQVNKRSNILCNLWFY